MTVKVSIHGNKGVKKLVCVKKFSISPYYQPGPVAASSESGKYRKMPGNRFI